MIGFSSARRVLRACIYAATLSSLGAPSAFAACYDGLGCTDRNRFNYDALVQGPSCDFLYAMRNQIYKDHGYCFHTPRAIQTLGNQGCYTSDMGRVAMSPLERGNATIIQRAEQARGCPI